MSPKVGNVVFSSWFGNGIVLQVHCKAAADVWHVSALFVGREQDGTSAPKMTVRDVNVEQVEMIVEGFNDSIGSAWEVARD